MTMEIFTKSIMQMAKHLTVVSSRTIPCLNFFQHILTMNRKYFFKNKKKISSILDKSVEIARQEIGKKGYSLIWNNCEHFANYCKTGKRTSIQVQVIFTISYDG